MVIREKAVFVVIIALLLHIQVFAADWPQWRGENRDGIWREKDIVQKFEAQQLPIRWRVKIANGYSGPTVAKGRVYVTDRLTSPSQNDRVHCFDAMTGDEIWSHSYESIYKKSAIQTAPEPQLQSTTVGPIHWALWDICSVSMLLKETSSGVKIYTPNTKSVCQSGA